MTNATISAISHYVPALAVTNDDLAKFLDTSDEWVFSRTGIRQRYIAAEETSYEMAAKASQQAMAEMQLDPMDIDMIIVATFTAEYAMPSMACLVQKEIGAKKAMCFDVNAACSGFVYGLDVADQFIRTGKYSNVLVIGSEKISQILDWDDRGTCVLFGDGAGAAVVQATDAIGIIDTINYAIGEDFSSLVAENRINTTPYYEGKDDHNLRMNGQEVFQFACRKVPEVMNELVQKNAMAIDDIDLFVLHQANARIITKIAKRLKLDVSKFYMNMNKYGNTSAASIPIALSELAEKGQLKGKKVVISGFGAGLTYGASLIQF